VLTLAQVAKALRVSPRSVYRYEECGLLRRRSRKGASPQLFDETEVAQLAQQPRCGYTKPGRGRGRGLRGTLMQLADLRAEMERLAARIDAIAEGRPLVSPAPDESGPRLTAAGDARCQ